MTVAFIIIYTLGKIPQSSVNLLDRNSKKNETFQTAALIKSSRYPRSEEGEYEDRL